MLALNQAKKKVKKFIEKSPIEGFEDPTGIVKGVGESLKKDLVGPDSMSVMWEQFFFKGEKDSGHHGGDMTEGQEVDLKSQHAKDEAQKIHDVDPGINYRREILHYRENEGSKENRELQMTVNEIMGELQRLISSSDTIIREQFQEIAVEQKPIEVGKYHINFFTFMLSVIRSARMKVEDSSAWMQTAAGKKGKKDYWGMFKKHGTTFGMSNERSVSTQTG